MNGQWVGNYAGTNSGEILVDIDAVEDVYQGVAYLRDAAMNLPGSCVAFRTADRSDTQSFTANIFPINPRTKLEDSWENVRALFPAGTVFPTQATVAASLVCDALSLQWQTNIGTQGTCVLPKSQASKPSEVAAEPMTWLDFKRYVENLNGRTLVFRGQTKPWRLRTTFHRYRRADLRRFLSEDVPVLHQHLTARTRHVFNLQNPSENGAFLSLVQHHGYPTPLLDWTYSPYVAVFFAYRGISNRTASEAGVDEKVRVYVFDQAQWRKDFNQLTQLIMSSRHFSKMDFIAIDNERSIPQQSTSFVTNVDDIETYIRSKEQPGKTYVTAIDLPVRERMRVEQELRYMGITAGSLFPGLDGACEALRDDRFES